MQQVYTCNVFRTPRQTITVSGDEHLENLVSMQHLFCKETPFRSEIMKIMRYNDLEQTSTLFLRENRNQNASNFANAICIHDTFMLSNQYIDFCYSEQFIANFIPCFLQFSFGFLCMALLVLKT